MANFTLITYGPLKEGFFWFDCATNTALGRQPNAYDNWNSNDSMARTYIRLNCGTIQSKLLYDVKTVYRCYKAFEKYHLNEGPCYIKPCLALERVTWLVVTLSAVDGQTQKGASVIYSLIKIDAFWFRFSLEIWTWYVT